MPYTSAFEEYLNALSGTEEPIGTDYMPGLIAPPTPPKASRGSLYDFLGNLAWGALDEAGFAIPGAIAKKAGIDPITPETGLGAAGEIVGRFGGFVAGGPLLIGRAGLKLAAKPFIKAAGKEVTEGIAKKVAGEGAKLATKTGAKAEGIAQTVQTATARYSSLNQKAKWSKDIADNFGATSSKILRKTVNNNVRKGVITRAEGDALQKVFKENLHKQSFDDFIGMMQARYPGKKGWVLGEMINEAVIWGTIDGLMEFPRSYSQDRPYDKMQPLWGIGIGGTLGSLNAFMPGGKGSSFRGDFLDGLKGVFSRNVFREMSYEDLISHSKIHAGFKKTQEANPIYTRTVDFKGKKIDVDFRDPEGLASKSIDGAIIGKETQAAILRKALRETASEEGKDLIKWAAKEEWQNISDNWLRMVTSGVVMNMPMMTELGNLDQLAPEALATQFLIGAFIGRKGMPHTLDIGRRVNNVRKGLSSLGLEPKQLIQDIPTFGAAGVSELNPMNNDQNLRDMQTDIRDAGIITTETDLVGRPLQPGEQSARMASQTEDLSIFNELHYYLKGTLKEGEHLLSLDEISADQARAIQDIVKQKKWDVLEGGKAESVEDFRTVMDDNVEKSAKLFENQIVETVKTILGEPGVDILVSENENMGKIPRAIDVSEQVRIAARNGELTSLRDADGNVLEGDAAVAAINETLMKVNNLLKTVKQIGRAEEITNPDTNVKFIDNETTLETVGGYLRQAEGMISNQLGNKIPLNFSDMPDIGGFLQINQIKKAKGVISKLFDRGHPEHDQIKKALINSGLLVRSDDSLVDTYFIIGDVNKIEITNAPDDADLSSAYKLLNSIHSIMSAKHQYDPDTSGETFQIDYSSIMGGKFSLMNQLGMRGLNTSEGMLTMYTRDIVRTIVTDNIAGSHLNAEHIDALLELSISGYDVAKYNSSAKRDYYGFVVRKLKTNSGDEHMQNLVNEYNNFIDDMVKAGTKTDGSKVIAVEKEPFVVVNDNIVADLHSRIKNNIGEGKKLVKEDLIDFLDKIEGNDHFRERMILYLQDHPANAARLMAFLHANKIVKVDKGPGSKRYSYDLDMLTEARITEINDKMTRAGITNDNVDAHIKAAEEKYHAMMEGSHETSIGKKQKSQAEFFEAYRPEQFETKDQNSFIANHLRTGTLGDLNPNRIQDIISSLSVEVKQDGKAVRVRATELSPTSSKYRELRADVAGLVATKINSLTVKMIGYREGKLDFAHSNIQDNGLSKFLEGIGVDYFIVNPNALVYLKDRYGFSRKRFIDISSLASKKTRHTDDEKAAYAHFEEQLLKATEFNIDGVKGDITGSTGEEGLVMIHIADWLPPLAVRKSDRERILAAWEEFAASKFSEEGTYRNKISEESLKRVNQLTERLRSEEHSFDYHEDALRAMIFERMNGTLDFLKLMDEIGPDLYKKTAKRASLFYTPSAKRMSIDGLDALRNIAVTDQEQTIVNKYTSQKGWGVAIFDDTPGNGFGTSVKNRINADLRRLKIDKTYDDLQPGREDVSGYDSIAYISTDMARMLSMYYGMDFDGTHFVWKPVISSDAPGRNLYGKTVFIHDPTNQHVFTKNKGLDVLLAKSGAKIGAERTQTFGEGQKLIQMPIDNITDVNAADGFLSKNIVNMEFESLGIIQAPKKEANAKLSHSLWNYANTETSKMIFGKYIDAPLNEAMANIQQIFSNPAMLRHAMLDLQGIDSDFGLSAMMASGTGGRNMGAFVRFLQSSDHANPMAFGDKIVMNILKRKMIDPIVTPQAEFNGTRFGGQAVLMQSMSSQFRDLKQTIINEDTGELTQYGEVYLPGYELESSLRMPGNSDMKVKIIRRRPGKEADQQIDLNELRDGNKEKGIKPLSKRDQTVFDRATTMGQMQNILEALPDDFQLAVVSTRFPRTRPNDMMILGVKGFLEKDFGNSMIVNDYDVLSVFEGDYDVDKAHYMWMNTDEVFNHIGDMKEWWVPGVEPGQFTPEIPGLQLVSDNSARANAAWRESAADVKAYKGAVGMVQKMTRQVNHVRDLAATITLGDGKTKMGLLFKNEKGEQIVMDWDNQDWFMRTALESQAMIDAQADRSLFTHIEDCRDRYLFQLLEESITRQQISKGKEKKVGFMRERADNPTANKRRIRLFRKLNADGSESNENLSKLEKDIIRTMLTEYGSMLQLSTDVYDGTGDSRKADYGDYISIGRDYFKHIRNLNKSIYRKLRKTWGRDPMFREMFKETRVIPKKWDPKTKSKVDDPDNSYFWITEGAGPFHNDVIEKGKRIADGEGGSPFEQSLQRIESQDPLGYEDRVRLLNNEYTELDNTLDRFIDDAFNEDDFLSTIMGAFKKKNDAIKAIRWAKSQFYKAKTKKQTDALKKIVAEQEMFLKEQMGVELSKKYEETKLAKHLPEYGRLVNIETDQEVREGTTQMYVLAPELSNFKGGREDFFSDLGAIKNMERSFYADDANLKDTLPFKDHTLLTKDQRLRLKFKPDQDTFNEIFTEMMDTMIDKHGMLFLWNYAAPKQMNNQVGVYQNRALPIATITSKRYKRMLNYLANKAGTDEYFAKVLSIVAKRDGIYRNLFSGNTNMLGFNAEAMADQMLRIPKFGSEMIGMFDSYTRYFVDRDMSTTNPYRSGPSFDHALAFFKSIYKMAGREGEFDEAGKGLSKINELMMANRMVDPLTYMTLMSNINKDIYGFVSRRFNSKQTEAGLEPITSPDLLNNEMFIMLGGNTHSGSGLTLNPVDGMSYGKALWGEVMARQASEITSQPRKGRLDDFFSCTRAGG